MCLCKICTVSEFGKAGKSTCVLDYRPLTSGGFGKAGKSTCVLDYRPLNSGGSLAVRILYFLRPKLIVLYDFGASFLDHNTINF